MTAVEIGAGTGHTTALLAHRLGGQSVTGIEIDPDLHRLGEHILAEQHLSSRIVLADGLDPRVIEAADRVLVGYEASFVPPPWIKGVRPGGMLLARIAGGLGTGHHLLLRRPNDGAAELTGRFLDWTSPLTAARRRAGHRQVRRRRDPAPGPIRSGYTATPPDASAGDTTRTFIAQLHLPPGIRRSVRAMDEHGWATYLNAPDGSWAEIGHRADHVGRHPVRPVGPGRLAEALERAHVDYDELGRPAWTDLGVTATADGSRVGHGDPVAGRSWPLAPPPAHSS